MRLDLTVRIIWDRDGRPSFRMVKSDHIFQFFTSRMSEFVQFPEPFFLVLVWEEGSHAPGWSNLLTSSNSTLDFTYRGLSLVWIHSFAWLSCVVFTFSPLKSKYSRSPPPPTVHRNNFPYICAQWRIHGGDQGDISSKIPNYNEKKKKEKKEKRKKFYCLS